MQDTTRAMRNFDASEMLSQSDDLESSEDEYYPSSEGEEVRANSSLENESEEAEEELSDEHPDQSQPNSSRQSPNASTLPSQAQAHGS